MQSSLWTEKYKPTKREDLPSDKKTISMIFSWINNWEKQKKIAGKILSKRSSKRKSKNEEKIPPSCLLLVGSTGIGKTNLVEILTQETNHELYKLNLSNIKSPKNVQEVLSSLVNPVNILNVFEKKENKKVIVVVDGLESISTPVEKSNIKELPKKNDTNWYFPIIFISDKRHNKLLSEFKKNCTTYYLSQPDYYMMKKICMNIMLKEKIYIEHNDIMDTIIEHAQSDIRRLVQTLQELKKIYEEEKITEKDMIDYCKISKRKDLDIGLFDNAGKLFYEYKDIPTCMQLFGMDTTLVPLMVQENYQSVIIENAKQRNETQLQALDTMINVCKSLSCGDGIESYMFEKQNWDIKKLNGFRTCVEPSYYINKNNIKKVMRVILTFPTDLNKTSIKNINKKNINNTDEYFKNKNTLDYIQMSKILKKLISENRIKKLAKLLKPYKPSIIVIESLLKIDKIKFTGLKLSNNKKKVTITLTSKQKNKLEKYLKT